ncbi:MAG: hypothetical protein PHF56_12400 [Desulfuromonadaceae bacterium]|nr:hypothetical protein [Desulfuromonadaceae bacterium]
MLTVPYRGHTLIGVPAIHNRAVFAEIVNRNCAAGGMCPEAVAVELDPAAVSAVAAWLAELGVIAGLKPLPCMLGLSRQNKRIHPQFLEAALHLQKTSGKQLHELPPDLLYRELGYAAVSILFLSPVDSMIEAIRCALEMQIPLYGIDMDDSPVLIERGTCTIRDLDEARSNFKEFVHLHGGLTDRFRDGHSDVRRETVMTARLKNLLQRHDRVLFSCGLGHWRSICRMLSDESLQPAYEVPQQGPVVYDRILIHPQKAAQQMDLFPGIAAAYEALRQPAHSRTGTPNDVDFQEQFRICINRACDRYFDVLKKDGGKTDSPESRHGFGFFSTFLANHCLLSQRKTPDLFTTISVARSMMPGGFVEALTESFMEFPWVSPSDFPDLPVIGPDTGHNEQKRGGSQRVVMKTPLAERDNDRMGYENSKPFHASSLHSQEDQDLSAFKWQWQDEPTVTSRDDHDYWCNYIWPPNEYLLFATVYEAVNVANARYSERRTEPFLDSMCDGIDLKASLRSVVTGENRLFVKRTLKRKYRPVTGEPVSPSYSKYLELQPTVFIFSRETCSRDFKWECLRPGDSELYHDLSTRGKRLFNKVTLNKGNTFISSIHFSEPLPIPKYMEPWVNSLRMLQGSLCFGNPCVNFYQSAIWLEKGGFRSSPILPGSGSIGELTDMYWERHNISIDKDNWRNALILMALPYAMNTRRVVVVAPQDFKISKDVYSQARRHKVEIVKLPLSYFSAERIDQIRRQYSVRASQGGKRYPPELERIFGHNQNTYLNLLPLEIRKQTRPK